MEVLLCLLPLQMKNSVLLLLLLVTVPWYVQRKVHLAQSCVEMVPILNLIHRYCISVRVECGSLLRFIILKQVLLGQTVLVSL